MLTLTRTPERSALIRSLDWLHNVGEAATVASWIVVWNNDTLMSDTNDDIVKSMVSEGADPDNVTTSMPAGSSLVYEVSYRPIGYGGYGNTASSRTPSHSSCLCIRPSTPFRDFGLTGPVLFEPQKRRSVKNLIWVCGTADWAYINAHHGIDLAPRDDLESLVYTACFVLTAGLPWLTAASVWESDRNKRVRVCNSKTSFSPRRSQWNLLNYWLMLVNFPLERLPTTTFGIDVLKILRTD
ncbi:hypothetical protein AGABI2DRAFT_181394 [Agaricus bisporus var. bisporus H97]|uniref:hypothetical protein n=1 Tax=Agaricus bisporus var. bisporus (strain H97 / ATCC MYA-4626 / FGSC 10389) TaxID=936046 RepID=UPI00029F6141|nr:hypothetical protein AGABI2DRAFT_181394 [Agaricus bisporus var. bisporus H97]EKV42143.1 hypothetical protein AGABI2DRAFT_181394 [Agaricus bisporus var. bisporus H97]